MVATAIEPRVSCPACTDILAHDISATVQAIRGSLNPSSFYPLQARDDYGGKDPSNGTSIPNTTK